MQYTLIVRLDGRLPLCVCQHKQNCSTTEIYRFSQEYSYQDSKTGKKPLTNADNISLYYMVSGNILYITQCDSTIKMTAAYQFLKRLIENFEVTYTANKISQITQVNSLAEFEREIVTETENLKNNQSSDVDKLQANVNEIHQNMVENVDEVFNRGMKINQLETFTYDLVEGSKTILNNAKKLDCEAMWRQYSLFIIIGVFVILVIILKFFVFGKKKNN